MSGTKRGRRIACAGLTVRFERLNGEVNIWGASSVSGGESGLTRGLSIEIPGTWGAGGGGIRPDLGAGVLFVSGAKGPEGRE